MKQMPFSDPPSLYHNAIAGFWEPTVLETEHSSALGSQNAGVNGCKHGVRTLP